MANSQKFRYFTFLVYPESAPENWREILKRSHLQFAISPLHQPDDEVSKPHYHVIYHHGNPVTLSCARDYVPDGVPANGYLEPARAPRNLQRYLIHLDDPEKEQFKAGVGSIQVLNGFPLDLTREFSAAERREQRRKVHEFIRDYDVCEYSDLLDYLADIDLDLYDFACNHTILFNTYITSRRNKKAESAGQSLD